MGLSILDQVAPYTRLTKCMEFTDIDGSQHVTVQLVNRDNRAEFTVTLINGEPSPVDDTGEPAIYGTRAICEHAAYFVWLAQQFVGVHRPEPK